MLSIYRRVTRWPGGRRAFPRAICLKAPCVATMAPRFEVLEPDRGEVRMRDRRRVHNPIGTVQEVFHARIDRWVSPRQVD